MADPDNLPTNELKSSELQPNSTTSRSAVPISAGNHNHCLLLNLNFPLDKDAFQCKGKYDIIKFSPDGSLLALVYGTNVRLVQLGTRMPIGRPLVIERPITALTFHPTDATLAVSDTRGQIQLWHYNARGNNNEHCKVILHWHAFHLHTLLFSSDGHYLLSGGREEVLVKWQLESNHKQFLARVGGEILHLDASEDGLWLMMTLSNNSIRILSALDLLFTNQLRGIETTPRNRIPKTPKTVNTPRNTPRNTPHFSNITSASVNASASVISSIYKSGTTTSNSPSKSAVITTSGGAILMDPRSKSVVLNGSNGSLQFWDVVNDRHVLKVWAWRGGKLMFFADLD